MDLKTHLKASLAAALLETDGQRTSRLLEKTDKGYTVGALIAIGALGMLTSAGASVSAKERYLLELLLADLRVARDNAGDTT